MPSMLALRLTIISSKYPCLEHLFMVPKMLEPLKFYLYGNAGIPPNAFGLSVHVYRGGEGAKINGHP